MVKILSRGLHSGKTWEFLYPCFLVSTLFSRCPSLGGLDLVRGPQFEFPGYTVKPLLHHIRGSFQIGRMFSGVSINWISIHEIYIDGIEYVVAVNRV